MTTLLANAAHITLGTVSSLTAIRLGMGVALAGSTLSATRRQCHTCAAASGIAGGLPLGILGVAIYGSLLAASFLPHVSPIHVLLAAALSMAAGAHLMLLVLRQI